jgi:hypothetical protein
MIEVSSRRCSGRWRRYPMRTWPRPIGPLLARPGRRRAHGCAPRDSGEVQARLKPEQTAKINMPVVLLTGQEAPTPQRPKSAQWQPHYPMHTGWHWPDSSTSPTSWTRRLSRSICWGFLHGPTLHCEPDTIVEVEPLVTGPSLSTICMSAGPSPFPVYAHTRTSVHPPTLTPPLCHGLSVRTRAAP